MKRRSFLQYVIGGITALFLPKSAKPDIITANGTDKTVKWSEVGNPNDWKEPRKIKWRRWADIQCPCDRCQQVKTSVDRQNEFTAIYVGRQFRAKDKRIKWSKIGVKENMWIRYDWNESSYIDFPTLDSCEGLFNSEDCLIWLGNREIWKIKPYNYGLLFTTEFLGYREDFSRRIGYKINN